MPTIRFSKPLIFQLILIVEDDVISHCGANILNQLDFRILDAESQSFKFFFKIAFRFLEAGYCGSKSFNLGLNNVSVNVMVPKE